ncbi:ATP-dependent protease La [Methanosarcina mazei Go1]|jgi:predicted S18 family serine protease|uniref:ATP-dependent protease La n=1 Tax=Methanosarcina mazei (strain ATCC BAA-159 / DSM 3647 / Goe1 / Go1 / JCM 11833 / OCM 88) TaxID=192952 RepID=Q8PVP9_METMA|nr:S16 family serine protease [Methanosarcina mazei]AAM31609.1 ATP-dependent protease La [Methanosarcina mazei Go1]WIM41903.1 ATP-dependent protease [Methanosarcina mazei]WIM45353.1 ATP-dependent protease [Methanosarcina mazei]
MKSKLITVILVLSLFANAYFLLFEQTPVEGEQVQEMQAQINSLERENEILETQISQNNQSLNSYASQLDFYRERVYELENNLQACPAGMEGYASLQAPAVFQSIEPGRSGPFSRQVVTEEGALLNISVEIRSGKGRVLVQTTPLMGVIFQDAANTAVFVAQQETGVSLSGSDVIFSITADHEIPGVDGSSAGALMTLLTVAAINGTELNDSATLTGTIDAAGNVGAIGGVFEKAEASEAGGKTLFLLPRENSELVIYKLVERRVGGFTIVERVPEIVDAEDYIEDQMDIDVQYVDTIDDVLRYAM